MSGSCYIANYGNFYIDIMATLLRRVLPRIANIRNTFRYSNALTLVLDIFEKRANVCDDTTFRRL